MHQYGGDRDYTKYQIYFASSPSLEDNILIICHYCNAPIVREKDERYVIVAPACQRPIYLHDDDCYEGMVYGMVVFYKEFIK